MEASFRKASAFRLRFETAVFKTLNGQTVRLGCRERDGFPVGLPVEGRPRQADAVTVREILTLRTAKCLPQRGSSQCQTSAEKPNVVG
jgi:hypothetical protein